MSVATKSRAAMTVALVVASALQTAAAQQGSAEASPLIEITVTATKREESIQSVPVSITAISGEARMVRKVST